MSIEAKVIGAEKPGENLNVLVEFSRDGVFLSREVIVFTSSETLDQAALKAKINIVGNRLDRSDQSAVFAKTIIGTTVTVDVIPVSGGAPAPKV